MSSGFDKGFLPDPKDIEAAIMSKTKIILINSPNNPTGTVVPQSVLEEISAIAKAHDLCVVSDEVYDRISFEDRASFIYSCPGMENHALVINSFSKTYAMPGVRVRRPKGSFYVFADISSITNQSRQFALDLIKAEKVVVVPGYPFGQSCERCIRIACTINREKLSEAMDRLERFLAARIRSRSFK
ncbi:pyridoxal phosphate-dependent aminotransferase [Desulfobacter sp.]